MDLEKKAIERIKLASEMSMQYYGKPLVCTYSGGKDSDVMLELFKRSGAQFEAVNSHTTVDAPQTVYHIRKKFKELEEKGIKCTIHKPKLTMWQLIEKKKMPPCRMQRYCCEYLKENTTPNRFVATGVRWDESQKRSKRGIMEVPGAKIKDRITLMNDNDDKRLLIERCEIKGSMISNPIIDWRHHDIWDFIRSEKIEYNSLYDDGYKRVGCIGCPMAGKSRYKEFRDFPTYKRAYIRAFDKMLIAINEAGKKTRWKSGNDVFLWWMEDENIEGQMNIEDYLNQ
ncbi:phosphoadenosine phosphosulfate reductase family protein [Lacrimispora sp.]|uniref:phosphoadenosine phosphosulfate reductase family protein n=1 Tax=Lacrimispora sp. TaxID=2719234 RepID=UPI00285AAF09|nr:phosphoadenosine phosphosulfate reductase family protein [Lacrimispora sp.]MDR7815157.1 phosphoadenosine phosphosulfate reductase family protein [Lacrimispora sp.]